MNNGLVRLGIQAAISLILLGSGVWVLTTTGVKTDPALSLAAAGWVGAVCGYWLR